ncbi:hypothetical protein EDD11_008605, partial [Mortierella claussenii]
FVGPSEASVDSGSETEDEGDSISDGNDDDDDVDDGQKFGPHYIRTCWQGFTMLPLDIRSALCPTAGFTDTLQLFSETAYVDLLWDASSPVKAALENIVCTRTEALSYANNNYGGLFLILFIDDIDLIRNRPHKHQAGYGKTTTTMSSLAAHSPSNHGLRALERNVDDWSNIVRVPRSQRTVA